jgi:hypothetical protein
MESKIREETEENSTSSPSAMSWLDFFSIRFARMTVRHVSCEIPYSTAIVLKGSWFSKTRRRALGHSEEGIPYAAFFGPGLGCCIIEGVLL